MSAKVDGGIKNCILPLYKYYPLYPENLDKNSLPKENALESAKNIMLDS